MEAACFSEGEGGYQPYDEVLIIDNFGNFIENLIAEFKQLRLCLCDDKY
jgi:hypothetical protein